MYQDPPRPATTKLRLETHREGDATVIQCGGWLTFERAEALKSLGRTVIPQSKRIILDLKDVTRMDSGGLGAVVGLYVSARKANCEFLLVNYNTTIENLLRTAHLLSILSGEVD